MIYSLLILIAHCRFRKLLQEQRDTCATEEATLRTWLARGDGRTRAQMEGQIALLRQQLESVSSSRQMVRAPFDYS